MKRRAATAILICLTCLAGCSSHDQSADLERWLESTKGFSRVDARCTADRLAASLPDSSLEKLRHEGVAGVPSQQRQRVAEIIIACTADAP